MSDEYYFLSYSESLEATQVYTIEIEKEELLTNKYAGIVIAKCADSDKVITCTDG
ncbi:hypothetical protein EHE19_015190 [Ruminiclostridium herbifermentans]|uniref:Uncharacterized protein n=1 Tax=Ruminiclostridium herbifermentans TaxID=2488810 RepID=A0A7H1VLE8_9FIRM|nr:hypothetical protein [Ruminiclostridium herbifermentans]QNU66210.1 hypothetical protein EHE19_015190 [Ruminiclostridium herbifermentans]